MDLDDILDFGIHEGESIRGVSERDPDYLTWLYEEGIVDLHDSVIDIIVSST